MMILTFVFLMKYITKIISQQNEAENRLLEKISCKLKGQI